MFKKGRIPLIIFLLTLIGGIFHFYNLNWGAPYYFHPDERNIASAVSQLHYPAQMNPHFFAYGSLPIYAIYFTAVVTNFLSQITQFTSQAPVFAVTFSQAIIISRFFSALFATLLIPISFVLGKKLKNKNAGLLAAFLATTSVGFIQFAHFGTFEMWLTFFGTLLFWLCLEYLKAPKLKTLLLLSLCFGVLVATKVTSLALIPIPLAVLIVHSFQHTIQTPNLRPLRRVDIRNSDFLSFLLFLKNMLFFVLIALLFYVLTNPFVFLAQNDFLSSMHYESGVALGTEPVFYTGIFYNTIPVVYQFLHVFPFLLNPLLTILFIPAFIYLLMLMIKRKSSHMLLLVAFFLILLFSQVFLFVKWTRYVMPTLPFIYLILAIAATHSNSKKISRSLRSFSMLIIIIVCTLFAFSYFRTVFITTDSRIAAVTFAQHAIPVDATILSEPADLGVLPFQDAFPHITTFNFYELDNNSLDATESQLQQQIATTQYIVLPSPRILQGRMENPTRFPKSYLFYKSLLNGNLGFHKIYETPCDIFCKITYLGDPVYWWEQTVTVFDHPTVFIFKKNS